MIFGCSDAARARRRAQSGPQPLLQTLDHDGLRLGGVLSDIFGVNGQRVLDGLVAERSPRRILAGLTSHVQAKLAPLALAAALDPLALFALQMQVESVDRADAAPAAPWAHSASGRIHAQERPRVSCCGGESGLTTGQRIPDTPVVDGRQYVVEGSTDRPQRLALGRDAARAAAEQASTVASSR